MSALLGLPGTSKTEMIMYLIAATCLMLGERCTSVIQVEHLGRQWRNDISRTLGRHFEHYHVIDAVFKVQKPKILFFTPTNNTLDFV